MEYLEEHSFVLQVHSTHTNDLAKGVHLNLIIGNGSKATSKQNPDVLYMGYHPTQPFFFVRSSHPPKLYLVEGIRLGLGCWT